MVIIEDVVCIPTIPTTDSDTRQKSGRFKSEPVDDLARNEWTIYFGIGGRLASEYTVGAQRVLALLPASGEGQISVAWA